VPKPITVEQINSKPLTANKTFTNRNFQILNTNSIKKFLWYVKHLGKLFIEKSIYTTTPTPHNITI